MRISEFFQESKEQSRVKTRIVTKYFATWARIILPRTRGGKLAYIELFAGRGRYEDKTLSTPLLILDHAIADPALRAQLVTVFAG